MIENSLYTGELDLYKVPADHLRLRSFYEFLQFYREDLHTIYEYPSICLFVFQRLQKSTTKLIERLLSSDNGVPENTINSWKSEATDSKEGEVEQQLLTDLNILQSIDMDDGLRGWVLMSTFAKTLQTALVSGVESWLISDAIPGSNARSVEFLDNHAMCRWLGVLNFLARLNMKSINTETLHTLGAMKAISFKPDGTITNTKIGYQFLFENLQTQVSYFMLAYLDSCPERGLSLPKCLSFLCELRSATLGSAYSSEKLTKDMLEFLWHICEFGLVYQERKDGCFYPTRLAKYFCMSSPPILTEVQHVHDIGRKCDFSAYTGFILVECNYRIYAYTNADIHIAILALFSKIEYRFPGFIVAEMTKETLSAAFSLGITGENIVRYLEHNAHPQMHKSAKKEKTTTLLPQPVIAYIKLWENKVINSLI